MAYIWLIYGLLYMGYVWVICGLYMGYMWVICGLYEHLCDFRVGMG